MRRRAVASAYVQAGLSDAIAYELGPIDIVYIAHVSEAAILVTGNRRMHSGGD